MSEQQHDEAPAGTGPDAEPAAAEPAGAPDIIDTLRATREATGAAVDVTLGGYIEEHERPPAFEGVDGQPYTVAVELEDLGSGPRRWAAFLVFVRWAATGAGIMAHVESGDVATGASEEEARAGANELSLFEVKAELDEAIRRKRAAMED